MNDDSTNWIEFIDSDQMPLANFVINQINDLKNENIFLAQQIKLLKDDIDFLKAQNTASAFKK